MTSKRRSNKINLLSLSFVSKWPHFQGFINSSFLSKAKDILNNLYIFE